MIKRSLVMMMAYLVILQLSTHHAKCVVDEMMVDVYLKINP